MTSRKEWRWTSIPATCGWDKPGHAHDCGDRAAGRLSVRPAVSLRMNSVCEFENSGADRHQNRDREQGEYKPQHTRQNATTATAMSIIATCAD